MNSNAMADGGSNNNSAQQNDPVRHGNNAALQYPQNAQHHIVHNQNNPFLPQSNHQNVPVTQNDIVAPQTNVPVRPNVQVNEGDMFARQTYQNAQQSIPFNQNNVVAPQGFQTGQQIGNMYQQFPPGHDASATQAFPLNRGVYPHGQHGYPSVYPGTPGNDVFYPYPNNTFGHAQSGNSFPQSQVGTQFVPQGPTGYMAGQMVRPGGFLPAMGNQYVVNTGACNPQQPNAPMQPTTSANLVGFKAPSQQPAQSLGPRVQELNNDDDEDEDDDAHSKPTRAQTGRGSVPRGRGKKGSGRSGGSKNPSGIQKKSGGKHGKGAHGKKANPALPAAVPNPTPAPPSQPPSICGNCGKEGHKLSRCAHPSIDGYVHGCPFCNTKEHEADCPKPAHEKPSGTRILGWAVHGRANRPPLALYWDWYKFVREAVEGGIGRWESHLKKFPWSVQFVRQTIAQNQAPWESLDYKASGGFDHRVLDHSTRHLRAVKENYLTLMQGPRPSASIPPLAIKTVEPDPAGRNTPWPQIPPPPSN